MGVDWYTCRGCDEPFNTCGDHFFCEDCHNVQCYSCTDCESCKEIEQLKYCKYCNLATELRSTTRLDLLYDLLYDILDVHIEDILDICEEKCTCDRECNECNRECFKNDSKRCKSCDRIICLECENNGDVYCNLCI